MSILDRLLGLKLVEEEELTDTTWWSETVVQGLEQDEFDQLESNEDLFVVRRSRQADFN
jgi:hypothetical protein